MFNEMDKSLRRRLLDYTCTSVTNSARCIRIEEVTLHGYKTQNVKRPNIPYTVCNMRTVTLHHKQQTLRHNYVSGKTNDPFMHQEVRLSHRLHPHWPHSKLEDNHMNAMRLRGWQASKQRQTMLLSSSHRQSAAVTRIPSTLGLQNPRNASLKNCTLRPTLRPIHKQHDVVSFITAANKPNPNGLFLQQKKSLRFRTASR